MKVILKKRLNASILLIISLGLGESNHFQEIPAETMEHLYNLFAVLMELVEKRGKEGYKEALSKLPPEYHNNWDQLLQYSAQVRTQLDFSCFKA